MLSSSIALLASSPPPPLPSYHAGKTTVSMTSSPEEFGQSVLQQVQGLASKVATANNTNKRNRNGSQRDPVAVKGEGGRVFRVLRPFDDDAEEDELSQQRKRERKEKKQVWAALENLERDMQMLDRLVVQKPQLSPLELSLLSLSVLSAFSSPFLGSGEILEVLAPSSAAFSAAVGIGAEYVGKIAVADGKEVAASALACAAEAEGFLANAERAKAIIPVCVGLGALAASFALLLPVLLDTSITEVFLACPLVGILTAAVANLALEETKSFCVRAMSVGNRRFAKSGLVGRTWLSATEQVTQKSRGGVRKWRTFAFSVLPSPIIGTLVPGSLSAKAIVITALAAAQVAFYLAQAEATLARATDAVALKSRSAAVCDTYANQGARSSAILPFTSALSSLCAAATAAIVEFPFVESLGAAGTVQGFAGQAFLVASFPALSALLAAAASVSKARCEVDAEAATQAASTLALEYDGIASDANDPVLRPVQGVLDLIQLTVKASLWEPLKRRIPRLFKYWYAKLWIRPIMRRRLRGGQPKQEKRQQQEQFDDDNVATAYSYS